MPNEERIKIGNLIDNAADELRAGVRSGAIGFGSPEHPAAILYFGSNSATFQPVIAHGLTECWGGKAESICSLTVSAPDAFRKEGGCRAAFQNELDEMLRVSLHSFANMNILDIFCILDTRGMDAATFYDWYMCIQDVQAALNDWPAQTMLMLLLDFSFGTGNGDAIKSKLWNIYQDTAAGGEAHHLYDCVFLCSNRTSSGGFNDLFAEHSLEKHGSWNILADMIALADSGKDDASRIYDGGMPGIAASLKQASKPTEEIAAICIAEIMNLIDECQQSLSGKPLSADEIDQALGMRSGESFFTDFIDMTIKRIVSQYQGFEEGLPSSRLGVSLAGMTYEQADEESRGCLSAFVESNQFAEIENELGGKFQGQLSDMISEELNERLDVPMMLSRQLESWNNDIRLRFSSFLQRSGFGNGIEDAVKIKLYERVRRVAESCYLNVFENLYRNAEAVEREFNALAYEANLRAGDGTDSLYTFYKNRVDSYFVGNSALHKVLSLDSKPEGLCDALLNDALLPLFTSNIGGDDVFKLNFMDELVARNGAGMADMVAGKVVGECLVTNLDKSVSYWSLSAFRLHCLEAYFIHDDGVPGSASSKLNDYLEGYPLPVGSSRVFFNTSSSDSATSLWLYKLSEDQIKY